MLPLKISFGLSILLSMLCLTSCVTKFQVAVPQIQLISIPDSVHQWLLIDRSPIRSKNGPAPRLKRDDAIYKRFDQPSILILESFIKYVENEVTEHQVIPIHLQLAKKTGSPPPLLDQESTAYLCNEYKADALVALEGLSIKYDTLVYEDPEVIGGGYWQAKLNIRIYAMWRTYSGDGSAVWDQWTEKYREHMIGGGSSKAKAIAKLPSLYEIENEWVAERGKVYAASLFPAKINVDRKIYLGKSGPIEKIALDMEKAGNLAMVGKWEEAALLWAPIADLDQLDRTAAKAAYNMGLACEALGDLTKAREWLFLASEKYHFSPAKVYLDILRQRLQEYEETKS
ncbi:MAG: DUF6340 family protein [Bacteroidia bacterium]